MKKLLVVSLLFVIAAVHAQKVDSIKIREKKYDLICRYLDNMRNGYKGTIVICVDEDYEPIDSVTVFLMPSHDYTLDSIAMTKIKHHEITNGIGICRFDKFNDEKQTFVGIKGNISFDYKYGQFDDDDKNKGDYILQANMNRKKRGVRLILHTNDDNSK